MREGRRQFSNFVDLPSQRLQEDGRTGGESQDCAMRLQGGRCVTYQEVSETFHEAAASLPFMPLKFPAEGDFSNEEVGNLGTVIHETARLLAQRFGLDDATDFGQIDTSMTDIRDFCPENLRDRKCEARRYREVEGTCNNLEHPLWAAARVAHHRFLPYSFSDGISSPRVAASGGELPSARLVSSQVHRDSGFHDHAVTVMLVAWGQFTDHDITLTAEIDEVLQEDFNCCSGPNTTHPMCFPIEIPAGDHFFSSHGEDCMHFVRSNAGLRPDCRLGPRETLNRITSVLDGNTVYSNDPASLASIRLYRGGRMRTLPVFKDMGLQDLLPLSLEDPDSGCIRPSEDVFCFLTGDPRVNEQTVLCLIHTMMIRQHNRMAADLAAINPHWGDETLFQEARHINAAIIQHITFNEYLPMVLGREALHRHGLVLYNDGYFDGYDPAVNPSAGQGFTTAAYRFGHSLLPSTIERWTSSHRFLGTQKLSEMLQQPYDLFKPGWADHYVLGMVNQVAQAMDDSLTSEVTNHLFQEPGTQFGLDLAALNMQRGREHGLPSYTAYRAWCGLPAVASWQELQGVMDNKTVAAYSRLYDSPEDLVEISSFPVLFYSFSQISPSHVFLPPSSKRLKPKQFTLPDKNPLGPWI